MQIVLLILKIIGMILLGILGLFLLLLAILLCSPLGYSATGCYHSDGNKKLLGNFHYLFHALKLDLMWDGRSVKFRLKLLGFQLKKGATSVKDQETDSDKEELSSEEDPFIHEVILDAEEESAEEELFPEEKSTEEDIIPEEEDTAEEDALPEEEETAEAEPFSEEEESAGEEALPEEDSDEAEIVNDAEAASVEAEQNLEAKEISEAEKAHPEDASDKESENETKKRKSGEKKKKPLDKVNKLIDQIKAGWEFISKPSVIKLRKKLIRRMMKILRHVLPKDLQVKGELGLEDPAFMGKIMEAYALLYAFWGEHFDITADFERQHIDVKGRIKGRVIPVYLLHQVICCAIALLLQKDIRKFVFGKLFHKDT